MVLESIIDPTRAESRPSLMIFIGAFYTSLAMFLSYFIFREYSSLFTVFLLTIACIPIIYKLTKLEEQKDLTDQDERALLKEHAHALSAFMYLFIGATIAFAFWYSVLPLDKVNVLYESQTATIYNINSRLDPIQPTGNAVDSTGAALIVTSNVTAFDIFLKIFFNNLKVLLFCILFSFVYGAGAIFILMWNASVVGTAIGNFIRSRIAALAASIDASFGQYFSVISIGLFKYAIHGIPEILAYFVAALGGGIISIAVTNHDYESRKFEHVLLDSADLIILSLVILFLAAVLEVYVTPLVFG